MSNIWEFLLQTATVSLTAGFLLLLKKLFEDKLPPRWQYTIWGLLALRSILPAATRNRYVLLPLPVWIEALKTAAEQNLTSVFSAPFDPVYLTSGLPWPAVSEQSTYSLTAGTPESSILLASLSITDWFFLLYIAGILVFLLRYVASYGKLRRLLRQNTHPVSPEVRNHVQEVAKKYNLKTCPIILVEGLPSAFVCGIFRLVLVLPAGQNMDEKILLHELLHLKYRDALQNMFWSLLRALHWCNPFLQYVFNRIGNDMEALCDQRVLERLEGEERRDYGRILLGMTNERYPRAFGTTSLSNGTANIALRIGCIARFKKYPKGMELVSLCIAIMLVSPLFAGTAIQEFHPRTDYSENRSLAFAAARLNRCTTVAGAVDTFYKALQEENSLLMATCSPPNVQAEIDACLRAEGIKDASNGFHYTLPVELDGFPYYDGGDAYYVYNLRPSGVSESFDAELLIPLHAILKYGNDMNEYLSEKGPEEPARLEAYTETYGSFRYPGCAVFYLTISEQDGSWTVTQRQPSDMYFTGHLGEGRLSYQAYASFLPLDSYGVYAAEGRTGTLQIRQNTILTVNNRKESSGMFGSHTVFDDTVKLNAEFEWHYDARDVVYTFTGLQEEAASVTHTYLQIWPLSTLEQAETITHREYISTSDSASSGSSTGHYRTSHTWESGLWDGRITSGGGSGYTLGPDDQKSIGENPLPAAYAVSIYLNGKLTDGLTALPTWEVSAE